MATANQDVIVREKWQAVKAEVKKTWSRLTDEELDLVNGDLTVLAELLKQKYGISAADSRTKLEELTANFRRDLKQESDSDNPLIAEERDGVRGTLRGQYRQF